MTERQTRPSYSSPAIIALRNFKSQWFLIPQGTGILAVILHQLVYQFNGLTIISYIFWILTIALLLFTLSVYILRVLKFPKESLHALASQLNETACLASIPITFTSIIQMMDISPVNAWGPGWGKAAYVLRWINTAMAVVACAGILYIFIKYKPPSMTGTGPVVNLPLITALTAAAGGGIICRYGALDASLQVPVIIVSYLLIGMALPLALGFDTVFLARLLDNNSPTGMNLYQDMMLCGRWGQGSFALQILGSVVMRGSFGQYNKGVFLTMDAAKPVGYPSILIGLMAWGQGTFWWAFAIISILHSAYSKRKQWRELTFGLSAWALVFPWGVYSNACNQLSTLLDSRAFAVWSTVLTLMLVIIWITNSILTVWGVFRGSLLELDQGWKRDSCHDRQVEMAENDELAAPNHGSQL